MNVQIQILKIVLINMMMQNHLHIIKIMQKNIINITILYLIKNITILIMII